MAAQPSAAWDEPQVKSALAQLELLQEQLDDLRLSIHRVVQPLSAPSLTTNPLLFTTFKQAIVGSQNDIKAFRTNWQSAEIQSVFEHTNQSLEKNGDLSEGAKVARYGWKQVGDVEETTDVSRRKSGLLKKEDVASRLDKEEVVKVMEEWQKANPQIRVRTKDDDREVLIELNSRALKLSFRVVIDPEAANSSDKLKAECLGNVKPFTTINRCVSTRPRANDLKYLLDMIAAYKTVKGSTCAKCEKLLDSSAEIPTARRRKELTDDNGATETIWEAFHEGCID